MNFTSAYFKGAAGVIDELIDQVKPELLEHYGKIGYQTKTDDSIVTRLDKELENKLKKVLSRYDSSVGFWGEEHGKVASTKSYWLVDPIDGTEAYVRGMPGCRNILTFVDNDVPLFAYAQRFITNDTFIAEKGKPTTKNGTPVKLSGRPLSRAWIEFSVNMEFADGYRIYQKLRPKIDGITVRRDFLEILEGKIDGLIVYKSGGSEWDYAPRALLIEGAGGKATNIGSVIYDFHDKSLIASHKAIFDELNFMVNKAIAQAQ